MNDILFHYRRVDPTTWAYLSSLLTFAIYFKFSRVWSVRNLDLILVILLCPGLLLVNYGSRQAKSNLATNESLGESVGISGVLNKDALSEGIGPGETSPAFLSPGNDVVPDGKSEPQEKASGEQGDAGEQSRASDSSLESASSKVSGSGGDLPSAGPSTLTPAQVEQTGYAWLFVVEGLLLIRLLIDPAMIRRPLLDPNMLPGGLTFLGVSLFVFLMANVITGSATSDDLAGARGADLLQQGIADNEKLSMTRHGPGYPLLFLIPQISTAGIMSSDTATELGNREVMYVATGQAMAILSHLAVVIGIVAIGYRHFDNIRTGVGAAVLYLMLPYTALMTGRVDHALPAALLVWMVLTYRWPLTSGMLLGLAAGVIYYPAFLLPLWISFYWQRGLKRFCGGILITTVILVASLAFTSTNLKHFWIQMRQMFGWQAPAMENIEGFWSLQFNYPVYRITVLAAVVVLCISLALWPARKNLGTLLSCSAAVMVSVQFWHAHGGGVFMAWFLPLLLLTVFRPNLEDRMALTVLEEGWLTRRRARKKRASQAS